MLQRKTTDIHRSIRLHEKWNKISSSVCRNSLWSIQQMNKQTNKQHEDEECLCSGAKTSSSLSIGKDKGRKKEKKKLEVKYCASPKKHSLESQLTWLSSPGCGSFWFLEIAKISISSLKGKLLCLSNFPGHYLYITSSYPKTVRVLI